MDKRTWAPFQSPTVKNICSNMTESEKNLVAAHGKSFGVKAAIFVVIPLVIGVDLRSSLVGLPGVIILLWIMFGAVILTRQRKKGKELLCSTDWAKSQGITPDKL